MFTACRSGKIAAIKNEHVDDRKALLTHQHHCCSVAAAGPSLLCDPCPCRLGTDPCSRNICSQEQKLPDTQAVPGMILKAASHHHTEDCVSPDLKAYHYGNSIKAYNIIRTCLLSEVCLTRSKLGPLLLCWRLIARISCAILSFSACDCRRFPIIS